MKTLFLKRISDTGIETFGVFLLNDHPLCLSLERPWKNNKRNVSCVPSGTYRCTPETSDRWGKIWRLQDVFNRDGILIHPANTVGDIQGCIAPGSSFQSERFIGVSSSKDALEKLVRLVGHQEFELRIA